MTWKQVIPGVFEGIPGEQQEEIQQEETRLVHLRMSKIPLLTMNTHRIETWQHKGNESWWPKIKRYAEGSYDHPILTFLGTVGTGKTHMALAIGWEWLERGKTVLYYQVEGLLDALRRGYRTWERGDPDGYQSTLAFTQNAGLLILDDLGAQQETEWTTSKLDQIIDHRYINQKPLIVTSNLALEQLPIRIMDRLREGVLIHLKGESFRKKK